VIEGSSDCAWNSCRSFAKERQLSYWKLQAGVKGKKGSHQFAPAAASDNKGPANRVRLQTVTWLNAIERVDLGAVCLILAQRSSYLMASVWFPTQNRHRLHAKEAF
jgi:hypothetical protein